MSTAVLIKREEKGFNVGDRQNRYIPIDNTRESDISLNFKVEDQEEIAKEGDIVGTDLTLELSVSSEEPYLRWWYYEILDHKEESIDLTRFNDSANVLFNHDSDRYIGVILKAWVEAKKLYTKIRFSRNELATKIVADINDRILSKVSIGYKILKLILEIRREEDYDTYRAIKWMPVEFSFVAVPADITVGVGRSLEFESTKVSTLTPKLSSKQENTSDLEPETNKVSTLTPDLNSKQEKEANEMTTVTINEQDIITKERERITAINALGTKYANFDVQTIIDRAIDENFSIEQIRSLLLDKVTEFQQPVARTDDPIGLSKREVKRYSLCKVILASLNRSWQGAEFEKEVHETLVSRNQKITGIDYSERSAFAAQIPMFDLTIDLGQANIGFKKLLRESLYRNILNNYAQDYRRAFTVGDALGGGNLVETSLDDQRFIDIYRNSAKLLRAGAQTFTGLVGNIDIPKQLSGVQDGTEAFWVGEGVNVGELAATFGKLEIRPKTLGAYMMSTRLMLLQSSIDIENFMRRELAMSIALGVDRAGIIGSGIGDEPLGILNTPGVNIITNGVDGGAPEWARIVQYETKVATVNADVGSFAWLGNARTRGELKSREKFSGTSGNTIWVDEVNMPGMGRVNGYPFHVTNQIPGDLTKGAGTNLSALIFGNFAEMFFSEWGVTEILSNPYSDTVFLSGGIMTRILHTCDISIRHPQAFTASTDLSTPLSDAI